MKRKILSNISLNFLIRVVSYLISFVELTYVTRVLQPEAFGKISFLSTFTGYYLMIANLGMPIYAMRSCASVRNDREKLSNTFHELWSLCIILSAISFAAFSLSVLLVPNLRKNGMLLAVFGSSILMQSVNCEWLYKGLEKYKFIAEVSLICKVFALCGILLFVKSSQNILIYAVFSVLISHGSNIVYFVMRRQYIGSKTAFRFNPVHLKPLLVFFMMSFAVSIYDNLDLTMLGFMKSEFDVGIYSVASKGKSVLAMTGGVVWGAILPYATTLWGENNRTDFERLAAKSLVFVTGFQTVVCAGCILFAHKIICLVAGDAYSGAVLSFRILLLSLIPIAMSNILGGQVLIPAGMERKLLISEICGAVFNFGANLVIIPRYSIAGAAVTTVISEVIVWILCVYYCKKEIKMDFGMGIARKIIKRGARGIHIVTFVFRSRIKKDKLPYYCPCCDTHLRSFADGGFVLRPDLYNVARYEGIDQKVICPVCGSLPRHRILAAWMQENKNLLEGKEILYFAQEKCIGRWCRRNRIRCTTADLYRKADLKLDIENTGLAASSYDLVFCNHVLEHVSDYKKALRELCRIIKPDGSIIVSFPVDTKLESVFEDSSIVSEEDSIQYFGQFDHKRIFGKDSRRMLENFGFSVMEISGQAPGCDEKIKPVIGPADYDYNILWKLTKPEQ